MRRWRKKNFLEAIVKIIIFGLLFLFLPFILFGQNVIGIDEAISNSAETVSRRVGTDKGVAVYQVTTISSNLSSHIIERLTSDLINFGVRVVDRQNTEIILQEREGYQATGRVSDDSAVLWANELGAGFVIIGTLEETKQFYILRLRTINAETAEVVANVIHNVKNDNYIKNIINIQKEFDPRLKTALLNTVFGLGSYLDGDWAGGLLVTGGYVAAIGLIIWELNLNYEDALAGYLGPIGVGIGGLSLLYGIIRPYIYTRNPRIADVSDNFNIAIIPTKNNIMAISLSYKLQF